MSKSGEEESFEGYFGEIDRVADDMSSKSVTAALKELEKLSLDDVPTEHQSGLLRRHAEFLYILSNHEKKEKRVDMLERAYRFALQGHTINPSDFDCAKILCSTCGRLAEESSMKKKLDYGFKFKTFLDEAIGISDQDFELTHMRGRFCYTVASLSLVERMAARLIGHIPDVSFQDALDDLLKADELEEGVAENELFVGKTYLAMGDYVNAKKWLLKTSSRESDVAMEQEHVDEAVELLHDKRLKSI